MTLQIAQDELCFCIDLKNAFGLEKIRFAHPVIGKSKILYCTCRPCTKQISDSIGNTLEMPIVALPNVATDHF